MRSSYILAAIIAIAAAAWILSGQIGGDANAVGEAETAAESAAEDRAAPEPAAARLAKVRTERRTAAVHTRELLLRGHTAPKRTVTLKAEAAGMVVKTAADKGDRVKRGTVIARIAIEDRTARLQETEALVRQRQLEYDAAKRLGKKGYRAETAVAGNAASLDAANAQLKRMKIELGKTVVRAPFDAILEERHVEIGSYLEPGKDVAVLVDVDPLLVVAQVSENEIGNMEQGKLGRARLATGQQVEGVVSFISTMADEQTRTFQVELEVANENGRLRPGVTADLILPAETLPAHFISPALLVLDDQGRIGVRVVEDGDRVAFHEARILDTAPDGVWLAGLPEQIELITVGQDYVRHGDRVKVAPAEVASQS